MKTVQQLLILAICFSTILALAGRVWAQSGSRAGINHGVIIPREIPALTPQTAQSYITVDGSAVIRVKPTQARIVIAVTTEATTASQCKIRMSEKMDQLRQAWGNSGLAKENIVEDFISVLPRYEFEVKPVEGKSVAMEKKAGYLMQTNVHLAVDVDDTMMKKVLDTAFENEVTDIIGFDLWSKELDQKKKDARALAIKAAKEKSDSVLNAIFEKRPPVINVQEKTTAHFPTSLYASFENSSSAQYTPSRNIPRILLARPKNTYYRGHISNTDLAPKDLQMRSEISVESHVRIYFESPAAKSFNTATREPRAAAK